MGLERSGRFFGELGLRRFRRLLRRRLLDDSGGLGRVRFCLLGGELVSEVLGRLVGGCSSGGCADVRGAWLKLCACDKDPRAQFFCLDGRCLCLGGGSRRLGGGRHRFRRQVGETFV